MLRRSPRYRLWYESNDSVFLTGCNQFREILKQLTDFSSETSGWRVFRTLDEAQAKAGLDPIAQLDEVIEFYQLQGLDGSRPGSPMQIGAEFIRETFVGRRISYMWHRRTAPDRFELQIEDTRYIAPVTLDRYLALAEIMLTWQRPRYMWVGDNQYVDKGHALFDGIRTVANWIAWVPQSVTPAQIPSAFIVRPHLGGTLIVTQPDFFNINDNQPAIDRANAVEYEMNEAGVLPLISDLR